MKLTLAEYISGIQNKNFSAIQVVSHYLQKAKENNSKTNAYISFADNYIKENLSSLEQKFLAWAPIAVKDLILTKWVKTTFASKMGENFVAPYSATCFARLEEAGACLVGKTNLDEFAMGGSNETSAFWPVVNPLGENRIPWWSSGWSAVAVADDTCVAALATDTWWSVRQPAFMCGVVWLKPTYGRISRYWVQSMASSFDQVWTLTKTVADAVTLLSIMAGEDEHDLTTAARGQEQTNLDKQARQEAIAKGSFVGKKIGYLKEFFDEWLDPLIADNTKRVLQEAEKAGATIVPIDFPLLKYCIATYYILMPAEVSTNLARFDWVRFWLQDDTADFDTIAEYYASVRERGFWKEVKRRILIWSYVLSAGFYDAYYRKAQQVRNKIQQEFKKIFASVDCIVGPTSPDLAWKIWERVDDPLKMYLADIYTVPANLWWFPAMHIPTGMVEKDGESFAVGVQVMADQRREDVIFDLWQAIENLKK